MADINLQDVNEWNEAWCVPTAFAAITGETPASISSLLSDVAADLGAFVEPMVSAGYNRAIWEAAIKRLGATYTLRGDCSGADLSEAPTIPEYLATANPENVQLVFCVRAIDGARHLFAMQGQTFVDTFTEGKVTATAGAEIPSDYHEFRVACIYTIEPISGVPRSM
ncbi:hypothetical protein [Mesorhizobium sp. M2A.F.Ca.ET.043.02.1.1]|uniref:hypothetical protein n=1 Tax=Mesorhizobium sp. M2A.F.Ca.ET.043.02.1.1 TaxID=2493670 RepID=UPI000F757F10|nr:hypothetical protein [Mesorhizobium sp. M2A.F.Ca.ET.043.02.1.1]AZO04336.1 hypothetical protein EJ068_15615 [Mesorhizobium sp. M2A.F.Ca.ET.043.02.1.1]